MADKKVVTKNTTFKTCMEMFAFSVSMESKRKISLWMEILYAAVIEDHELKLTSVFHQ